MESYRVTDWFGKTMFIHDGKVAELINTRKVFTRRALATKVTIALLTTTLFFSYIQQPVNASPDDQHNPVGMAENGTGNHSYSHRVNQRMNSDTKLPPVGQHHPTPTRSSNTLEPRDLKQQVTLQVIQSTSVIEKDNHRSKETDWHIARNRFNNLESAIKYRNIRALKSLTTGDDSRKTLFAMLFKKFIEIDATVTEPSVLNSGNTIVATLKINRMTLPNGSVSIPAESYSIVQLRLEQPIEAWTKISW